MNTQKLFILINYYDADLMSCQPSPDSPEYIVLREYKGEDLSTIDAEKEIRNTMGYFGIL